MEHDATRAKTGHDDATEARHGWLHRAAWLVAIWAASVAALAVVAYAFRFIMGWIGLTR